MDKLIQNTAEIRSLNIKKIVSSLRFGKTATKKKLQMDFFKLCNGIYKIINTAYKHTVEISDIRICNSMNYIELSVD